MAQQADSAVTRTESQIAAYRVLYPTYVSFSAKLQALLVDIIESKNIKYQIVESRAKDINSFAEKITRAGKSYEDPINQITDLCGCRIIVYYIDDVETVASIIKEELYLYEENLTRQPNNLEADRFGYLSAHYIVKLNQARANLIEWSIFSEFKAEIQIRTVIQHAWSAVSHALQYKQETATPSKLQRRLYRIAGLFELADDEFVAIRDIKENQQEEIRRKLNEGDDNVPLSPTSIKEFLRNWEGMKKIKSASIEAGFHYMERDDEEDINSIYKLSILGGISNVEGLSHALDRDYSRFLNDVQELERTHWVISDSFCVVLVLIAFNRERVNIDILSSIGFDASISMRLLKALELQADVVPRKKTPRSNH